MRSWAVRGASGASGGAPWCGTRPAAMEGSQPISSNAWAAASLSSPCPTSPRPPEAHPWHPLAAPYRLAQASQASPVPWCAGCVSFVSSVTSQAHIIWHASSTLACALPPSSHPVLVVRMLGNSASLPAHLRFVIGPLVHWLRLSTVPFFPRALARHLGLGPPDHAASASRLACSSKRRLASASVAKRVARRDNAAGVHRRDGSLRPLLRPRRCQYAWGTHARSLREDVPRPAASTRSSSPCDVTHGPGLSCHPSTHCPTSPAPPPPRNAPPAPPPLCTPPEATCDSH